MHTVTLSRLGIPMFVVANQKTFTTPQQSLYTVDLNLLDTLQVDFVAQYPGCYATLWKTFKCFGTLLLEFIEGFHFSTSFRDN